MADNTIPDDRSYTEEHEWVLIAPGADLPETPVKVGVTSVAAYGAGWLFEVLPTAAGLLLTAAEYAEKNEVSA